MQESKPKADPTLPWWASVVTGVLVGIFLDLDRHAPHWGWQWWVSFLGLVTMVVSAFYWGVSRGRGRGSR